MERARDGLTAKVPGERLRKMVRYGVLERKSYAEAPPRVEYMFTPFGKKFDAILDGIEQLQQSVDRTRG